MNKQEMRSRTKGFAISVINMVEGLPRTISGRVIAGQLVRSATSVGANYRSACLAKSGADFIAKLGIVAEEADESEYWMELLIESNMPTPVRVAELMDEARQIASIVIVARRTAQRRAAAAKSEVANHKS